MDFIAPLIGILVGLGVLLLLLSRTLVIVNQASTRLWSASAGTSAH